MMEGSFRDKKILLGVTGSIAAYKSVLLARLLMGAGAEVKVVMTPAAKAFIAPLTFSTLTAHSVYVELMEGNQWSNHVQLGLWADLMIIAPATANTMAKMAGGHADNMLLSVFLSARCPVFIAPAMDVDMWHHPATVRNLETLRRDGIHYIPVEKGPLASGLTGEGRMAEPEHILRHLSNYFTSQNDLSGKQVLITAGPTREAIDPVRFISNRSTGTMGIALAECLARRGATVHLVIGPVAVRVPSLLNTTVYAVESAEDMYRQCNALFPSVNAAIMAAAVADYTPENYTDQKIKKQKDDGTLRLKRTRDIAFELGRMKGADQYLIGFALETDAGVAAAFRKLDKKNLDFIVLNSLKDEGAGFGVDTNKVSLLFPDRSQRECPLLPKREVAEVIVDQLCVRAGWDKS